MNHTPGPWRRKVFHNGAFIISEGDPDNLESAVIASHPAHPDPDAGRANAALICAAPAMLSILEAIIGEAAFDGLPETLQERIEATIAVARERQGETCRDR